MVYVDVLEDGVAFLERRKFILDTMMVPVILRPVVDKRHGRKSQ